MDVPLRNHDPAVTGNPQDGKGVHSRFPKPCKHCMAYTVHPKIPREYRTHLAVDFGSASVPVKVSERGSNVSSAVPVGRQASLRIGDPQLQANAPMHEKKRERKSKQVWANLGLVVTLRAAGPAD
jgi:hypothetical protein